MVGLLLLLAAGAVAAGLHAVAGLMLTPFFGASPFFWAHVVASFPLSLALGILLGRPLRRRSAPATPYRIGAIAGGLCAAVPIALAPCARAILDRNPDAPFAPALAVLVLVTLPAALATAVLPTLARAVARKRGLLPVIIASPGGALLVYAGGGVLGIAACAPALLRGADTPAWALLVGLGVALGIVASLGCPGRQRVLWLGVVLGAGLACGASPSEVKSYEFQKALAQSWTLRVGRYYLRTTGRRVLARTEVLEHWKRLRTEIASGKDVPAVLIVRTLERMGACRLTGEGLRQILDIYLPERAKAPIMPLLERIETVTSDGRGKVALSLRWDDEEEEIRVALPAGDGEETTFVFTRDPELTIHVDRGERDTVTTISFGPLEIERAGFFEANDTQKTPVRVEDAVLFFDAYLLDLSVVDAPETVTIVVRAQGSVGAPKDKIIKVFRKHP